MSVIDASCTGCEEKVEKEIQRKKENGIELSEQEKQIEEGEADVPFTYGPFAIWNDVTRCRMCHRLGQVGAFLVAVAVGLVLIHGAGWSQPLAMRTAAGVWLAQMLIVGTLGRYPILGAKVGPKVESFFSKSTPDGESPNSTSETIEIDPDEMPEGSRTVLGEEDNDENEKIRQLKQRINELEQVNAKTREEKAEVESELEEKRNKLQELQQEKQQVEQDKEEFRDELQTKEE